MKKITLFFVFAILGAFTFSSYAQTLNQPAAWPNANWTLSGTFDAGGLLGDPTIDATFGFDDDTAGNGSLDALQATSPVIDLTAANGAGETWISISGDFVYYELGGDVLNIETYDADAMSWSALETFSGNSTNGDYLTCANAAAYTTATLNIAGFTATQLSGFQYRITYNDNAGWQWGFCVTSPTITSATPPSCFDPSALTASSIDGFSADLGWTENGTATLWNVELVDITAAGAQTMTATSSGVSNPFNQTGLIPSNNYEFYVQADCGVDGTSAWVGPFAFSTTVACPAPSSLSAFGITTTSAELGWIAEGSETAWDIELVDITAAGVATGTATATGVTNTYSQTGLTAANNYEFYVRADCAANGTSAWVGPVAFTTACATFTAPYTETFENAGAIPSCWSLGGDADWFFQNAGPNHVGNGGALSGSTASGGYYAVMDDSLPDSTDGSITSPNVDVSGLTTPALSFYEISNNEGNPNATLTVEVYDGAVWNTVGTYNTNTIAGAWEQKLVDLSGLTFTGPAQVRFSIADSGSFYDDIAIDDVTLDELPTCTAPVATAVVGTTDCGAGTFMIDVDVTDMGNATSFTIANDAGVASSTESAVNTYSVGPFTSGTNVTITVEHDQDSVCNLALSPVEYTCPPSNMDCANATTIACGDTINASSVGSTGTPEDVGCGMGDNGIWFTFVGTGADMTVAVDASFDHEVALASGSCGSLVNINCDDQSGNGSTETHTFTSALSETYYVYVARYNASSTVTGTVDITLTCAVVPTCFEATNLSATVLAGDVSADLAWDTEAGATSGYNWTVMASGDDPAVDTPVSNGSTAAGVTTATATGLTPAAAYDFYVQSNCDTNGLSEWAGPFSFTATAPPSNIDCANATPIACGETINASSVGSTGTQEDMGCSMGSNGIWFTFTGTGADITLDVAASFDHEVGLASGACGSLVNINCDDQTTGTETHTFTSTLNETYYVYVAHWNGTSTTTGTIDITLTCAALPPANDDCADAIGLSVGGLVSGDTSTATDSGIAPGACAPTGGASDIWYSFVANAVMAANGAKFDTTADHVLVYADCSSTTETYCLASGESTAPLTDGTTYFVRVYNSGVAKVQGPVNITLQEASLSTQDFDNGLAFSYYPNPVKNTLTLNAQQAITNVAVFNMLGQEVIRTAPNAVSNDVDMSNLQSGAYFVQVTIGAAVETVRVIKN